MRWLSACISLLAVERTSEGACRDPAFPVHARSLHTALGPLCSVTAVSSLCPVSRRAGTKSHPFGVPRDSTSCSEQAVFLCFKCRGYVRTPIHPAEPGSKASPVLKLPRRPSDPPAATLRDGRHLPSTCHRPGAVLSTSVWFLLLSPRSRKWVRLLSPLVGEARTGKMTRPRSQRSPLAERRGSELQFLTANANARLHLH